MSSFTTIRMEQLARLVGTPTCPLVIDVRTNEDFAADQRLLPGAIRRPHEAVAVWANEVRGGSAIVMCQRGLKLSEGAAAWLRQAGVPAEVRGAASRAGGRQVCP